MLMSRKLSIYAAEHEIKRGEAKGKSHSYLVLVDETDPSTPTPIEELHFTFTFDQKETIKSTVRREVLVPFERAEMFGQIGGDEEHVLRLWNKGLETALEIDKARIAFTSSASPTAKNCRAGTRAALKGMDVEIYLPDDSRFTPGSARDLFELLETREAANDHRYAEDPAAHHEALISQIN